ncbi:hypothetical protein ACFWOY_23390 [Streptomyces sp. NPDC058423]|uniref:hypothetical protein n=1 Tax=unclassified Streptomyces TaxID=2593676 RepID=UPI0036604911
MEQPVLSGTARDASGATFAIVGISNMPAIDWAQVLATLLRRVHHHLVPSPAGVVHEPARYVEVLAGGGSDEDGRIDRTRPAEEIAGR